MVVFKCRVFLSKAVAENPLKDKLLQRLAAAGLEYKFGVDASCCGEYDFHILPSFDSDEFSKLQAAGVNIIGITCALACLRAKPIAAFPRREVATCCSAMNEVMVLSSGFSYIEKKQIQQKVEWMRGTYGHKAADQPDFIIAKDVTCPKYRWAVSKQKPVVTLDWLKQCWLEHRLVSTDQYRLPCFTGLKISTTGFYKSAKRARIQTAITDNGGEFMDDLAKSETTHLVACVGEGQKYKRAKEWEIKVVSEKWLWQCIEAKVCLPEENFAVVEALESHGQPLAVEGNLPSPHISRVRGTPSQTSGESERSVSNGARNETSNTSGLLSTADLSRKQLLSDANCEYSPSGSGKSKSVSFAEVERTAPGGECDDMYLSACRITLVGFDPVEQKIAGRLITAGGGTRFLQYNDPVTHVVVRDLTEGTRSSLQQLDIVGSCNIVWATWLRDCIYAREHLKDLTEYRVSFESKPVLPFWNVNTKGEVPPAPSKTPEPKTPHVIDAGGKGKGVKGVELCSLTRQSLQSGIDGNEGQQQQDADGWLSFQKKRISNQEAVSDPHPSTENPLPNTETTSKQSEQMKTSSSEVASFKEPPIAKRSSRQNLFKGCSFDFEKSLPTETRNLAMEVIRRGGGVLCESIKDVPTYTIGNHGNHSTVEGKSFVSYHWLKASENGEKIFDPSHHVIFRPLTCQIPLLGFSSFIICASLYDTLERELMRNLSFCLGAKVTEKLTRRVTHLLCPHAQGEKYKTAIMWGIKVVKVEWLFSCVSNNCVVPVSDFQPQESTDTEFDGGEFLSTQNPTQAALLAAGRSGELGSQWEPSTQGGASQIPSCLFDSSKGLTGSMNQRVAKRILPPSSNSRSQHLSRGVTEGNNHLGLSGKPPIGRQAMLPPRPSGSSGGKNDVVSKTVEKSVTSANSMLSNSTLSSEFAKDSKRIREDEGSNGLSMQDVSRRTLKEAFDLAERVTGSDRKADNPKGKLVQENAKATKVESTSAEAIVGAQEPNDLAEESPPDVADVISKVLMHMVKRDTEIPESPRETRDLFSPDSIPLNGRTDPLGRHLTSKRQKTSAAWPGPNSEPELSRGDDWNSKTPPKQVDDYEQFQESQVSSQMVGYEEDMSARELLIEKVQLNSNGGSINKNWLEVKFDQTSKKSLQGLQGLLRAADANK